MFAAASQLVPLATKFCRQIVPPVVATLIAAGLISAYNRVVSSHLQQPRMSALYEASAAESTTAPISTIGMTKPPAPPVPPATETITIYEEAVAPERLAEKDANQEADKDQSLVKLAADPAPAPAPVKTASPAPRIEPKLEPRTEPHRVAAVEPAPPVVRAPAPVIVAVPPPVVTAPAGAPVVAAMPLPDQRPPQYPYPPYAPQVQLQPQYQPPPVIVGSAPVVTVPDRPNTRPLEEAQVQPAAPAHGALGTFVNALKPSTWFARAREFGDKIEAAGNDILPNIRQ